MNNYIITGGSGYVGKLLIAKLLTNQNTKEVIVIDKDFYDFKDSRIIFINKNLIESWEEEIPSSFFSDQENTHVIHLAWQIRTLFGQAEKQWAWNVGGSEKVFNFVKKHKDTISTFVHFSTVASYGADSENTFSKIFTEADSFRNTNYLYAQEKKVAEEILEKTFVDKANQLNIFVIRPASIAGKSGRERKSFGLQAALAGKVASENFVENFIFTLVKKTLGFMPATRGWARQFVSEVDIVDAAVTMCSSKKNFDKIEKYNLCPDGGFIDAFEMARMLGKRAVYLHPQLVRLLCFFAWYLTLGRIPTSAGVWKAYSYPILVDGSKILRDFDQFKYTKNVRQAYLD